MGSATKLALGTVKRELDRAEGLTLDVASSLFDAVDVVIATPALRQVLVDPGTPEAEKRALVDRLFGGKIDDLARGLLASAAGARWSNDDEFALGLQELAVRAVARSTGGYEQIGGELQSFLKVVQANHELELTLGSKLGDSSRKRELVERLFASRLSPATMTILRHLLTAPAGRRTRRVVTWAAELVADQAGRQVATVTVAKPLAAVQFERLRQGLGRRFGRDVQVAQVVDPAVIGGLRVQFGDEVIDDTVASKLGHLRRQFA